MDCKRYEIYYGFGIAYLYTPHDPKERFYTLANTCFGIRKSIECCEIRHVMDYEFEDYEIQDEEYERLEFSGDVYIWREDGARRMLEPYPDEDWDTHYCDDCKYEGEKEMKKILENSTTNTVNPKYGEMPCDGVRTDYLTAAGNKALADKIKAMREDELEVVIENIPVELCLKRIQKELDRAKELENGIAGIVAKLGG